MSERIRQIRHKGKVLAIVGAGHVNGINENLNKEEGNSEKIINELNETPEKSKWPKIVMLMIPILIFSAIGWLAYNGEIAAIQEVAKTWLILNMAFAGLGIIIARGHPLSVIVGSLASPFTSLNPTLAAGWFAGYTQFKMSTPTGKDAQDFLKLDDLSLLWKNNVGKILLVTTFGNVGSSVGAWIGTAGIIGLVVGL